MTKAELIKMIAHLDDNDELLFVNQGFDHDGYPEDRAVKVYKVLSEKKAELVEKNYGIHRYEEVEK